MIDFELSEEQLAIQDMARKFAEHEIAPIAEKLDRSQNLLQDFPWDLLRKGSQTGFRTAALPAAYDGPEFDFRSCVVLIDELAYADLACAMIFSQNWNWCRKIARRGTPAQKEKYLAAFRDDEAYLFSGDISESAGGALTAVRKGGDYVLNGKKAFMALGPRAKLLLVDARIESRAAAPKSGIFLVPGDAPGCTLVSVCDNVVIRMHPHGRVNFENVRIPAENLLGGDEQGPDPAFSAAGHLEISAHAMALARVALDAATRYSTERIQGGKAIIEHQAVALSLADMYIALQAGRSLLWQLAWALDTGQIDRAEALACKTFCTEAAVKVCSEAVELFGGSGVMRELPMQKYFRDSLVLLHMGGGNHANRATMGAMLEVTSAAQPLK